MELLRYKRILGLVILLPFLLANKDCHRAVTWSKKDGSKIYAAWAADHVDLDKKTKCSECHDDNRNNKVPPKVPNHHDAAWKREHGKYSQLRFGFGNENVCVLCHKDSFCSACHQQEQPADHNMFWKSRGHGTSVGLNRSRCEVCHITADFCERCHAETKPNDHKSALWGGSQDNHCQSCHFPLSSMGSQRCEVCHEGTPAHDKAPSPPASPFHVSGADCRSCHVSGGTLLKHTDGGVNCQSCHTL